MTSGGLRAGAVPASKVKGAISGKFGSQSHCVFSNVREMKYTSHYTAVTNIINAIFRITQNYGEEVTSLSFRGCDRPNRPLYLPLTWG